jgi:hypothetical protein
MIIKKIIINLFGNRFFLILKKIKNYDYRFQIIKFFISNLYQLNLYFLYKFNFKSRYPFINNKYFCTKKIELEPSFKDQVNKDLKLKNYLFSKKFSLNHLIWNYPLKYLEEVQMSWGFDRKFYISFLEKNFDKDLKDFYQGKNYRVEHVWLYRNLPNSFNVNNNYHTDGDLPGAIKIIIYISDVDIDSGPFSIVNNVTNEVEHILGNSGTTIFFDQKKLQHSGLPNKNKDRTVLSFLVYPSLRKRVNVSNQKPLNALCSLNPFTNYS